MIFLRYSAALLLFVILAGCAATPKAPLVLRPEGQVETLTSSVTLSVKTPDGGSGGSGYLIYRRPDRFHLAMLTPFGTTVMEFYARGDRITVINPGKGAAYVGTFADLPAKGGLQGWRLMGWVVNGDPLYDAAKPGNVARTAGDGKISVVEYDADGLLERKTAGNGVEVTYSDYRSYDGTPFPSVIEFTDRQSIRVKIAFDEPEINKPVDESELNPKLDGLTILPLSRLAGF